MDRRKKAQEAMLRRSREKQAKQDNMQQYYIVIGVFVGVCALAAIYTFLNPQQSFSQMPVIDESSILVHNGQNHRFTQAPNAFFEDWTISDAKRLFEQGLSDTQNIIPCKTQQDDMILPENFDWRDEYIQCVQPPNMVSRNCSSAYVQNVISVAQDKICMGSESGPIRLSAQEVLDCDRTSNGCQGGSCNRAITWGKKRGFVPESCYPNTGEPGECPEDNLLENSCRQTNNFYRLIDFCLATEVTGIKKEIMTNGPVIGQLTANTDFLTYKDGIYSKTQESFRFQGNHLVKIVGWESLPDESQAWIVENSWGEDWGDNGYAKISSGQGDTTLDFYAIALSAYPLTMAEYYQQEITQNDQMGEWTSDLETRILEGLNEEFDNDLIEEIDMDMLTDDF